MSNLHRNDLRRVIDLIDRSASLFAGRLYTSVFELNLAAGTSVSIGGVVGSLSVVSYSLGIQTEGTRDLRVQFFDGGAISGGTPILQVPSNKIIAQDAPFSFLAQGVTVDTPGTPTFDINLGDKSQPAISFDGGLNMFPPGHVGYMTLTQGSGGTEDYRISYLSASLAVN